MDSSKFIGLGVISYGNYDLYTFIKGEDYELFLISISTAAVWLKLVCRKLVSVQNILTACKRGGWVNKWPVIALPTPAAMKMCRMGE